MAGSSTILEFVLRAWKPSEAITSMQESNAGAALGSGLAADRNLCTATAYPARRRTHRYLTSGRTQKCPGVDPLHAAVSTRGDI